MKAGEVITIRISPTNLQAIVDILDSTNQYIPGMSLPSAASRAIQIAFQTLRNSNLIPTRDGFSYLETMERFADKRQTERKRVITGHLTADAMHSDSTSPAIAIGQMHVPKPTKDEPYIHTDAELGIIRYKKQILAQMQELQDKHDLDPINFDDSQRAEYDRLEAKLNSL